MRRSSHRKFGREIQQRDAFIKALLTALVLHGKVKTTVARAKTMKAEADKLVTLAKKGTLHGRRLLGAQLGATATDKMLADVAPKMAGRAGGYTRVLKLARRQSDGAPMAVIEFVA